MFLRGSNDLFGRSANRSSTIRGLNGNCNRAKLHERSRQLETGDDEREDHVQIWSCRQIPHFERRPVNAAVPFKQLESPPLG
jgi:hypothetical protein